MARKKRPRVTVESESQTGRNLTFKVNSTGEILTRAQLVRKIQDGSSLANDYYVAKRGGLLTPISKPDGDPSNNLG